MGEIMAQPHLSGLLKTVRKPRMPKAKADLNFLRTAAKLLRLAIARTGMSQKEAMAALGIDHAGQFSEMLDGKQKLWVHSLLTVDALPIWRELIVLAAMDAGCKVYRVVEIPEELSA